MPDQYFNEQVEPEPQQVTTTIVSSQLRLQVANLVKDLLDISIQQQSNRDITSAALPSVTGSIGATDYLKIPTSLLPGEVFGQPRGTYIPVQFGTKYNSTASIQLQQLLFDGRVVIGLQARATSLEWRKKSAEVTEEAIKTNIYKIYYQLVVSKTQIALLDANINRLNKLDHDTRELYKNGFAEKLDLDKIAVQVANLQTEKTKALNNFDIGYLRLKTLMGMPIKVLNVVGDHKPRVIQCVQHVMYPYARLDDWPTEAPYNDQKSRLVFIVRDVPQSMIEKAFEMFCGVRDVGESRAAC